MATTVNKGKLDALNAAVKTAGIAAPAEKVLEEAGKYYEYLTGGTKTAPVTKKHTPPAEVKTPPAPDVVNDSLGLGLEDTPPEETTTKAYEEEDVRKAAKALIETAIKAGNTQREGYAAASATIELHAKSIAEIPAEKRGTVIVALNKAAKEWGTK